MIGRFVRGVALVALASCVGGRSHAPPDATRERWIGSWEAAPQLVEPRNMPPAPGLEGTTLRQVVHVSLGGTRWRFRLSNEFGDDSLVVRAAHVARAGARDSIDPSGGAALSFAGARSVTIPRGQDVVSDPVRLSVAPISELSITLYLTHVPAALTGHPGSRQTSFVLTGNHVDDRALAGAATVEHWYVISGAEVISSAEGSVVVLGNSIADGRGSGTDKNDRWPDNLARRLAAAGNPSASIGVLNAGIGGNAVVRGGLGPTALARFERDVLEQRNARWLIISEGVNDIGGARPDSSAAVARHLIDAYADMIRRAHAAGMRVYGATVLPFAGSQYASSEHEAARQTVNRWIREAGAFDAVIDFDAVMRDPADPSRLRRECDSGDHLHPSELGYRVMADAIDLGLFRSRR